MRSSKARSRSKQNRSRSVGNIINRVFDSSGPEGKVRGTPQQIIDKYNQLARDAALANDRVAAENFQQHSEHYTRLLGEAMRELEAQRQSNPGHGWGGQDAAQGGQNGNQGWSQNGSQNGNGQGTYGSGAYGQGNGQSHGQAQGGQAAQRRGEDTPESMAPVQPGSQPADAAAEVKAPSAAPVAPEPPSELVAVEPSAPATASGHARRAPRGRPPVKAAERQIERPVERSAAADASSLPAFVTQGSPRRSPAPLDEGPLSVAGPDESALAAPTLVETPEDAPRPRVAAARKPRAPRAPRPAAEPDSATG